MSAHQVITGALNHGENVFAVGSVEGINFTVCAVGSDVVILSSSFERVQVIPGSGLDTERIVRCVNCCPDSGKIAATYGNLIRLFEPLSQPTDKSKHKLNYRWYETQSLAIDSAVGPVLWNLEGLRLLVCCDDRLLLYQHSSLSAMINHSRTQTPVMFSIAEEEHESQTSDDLVPAWECVWSIEMAAPPKYIRYSTDGTLFATCGVNDHALNKSGAVQFSFTYLQHPLPVCGFEWRKTGRYMSRRCVQNVLLTWCEDNTARIWKETVSTNTAPLNNDLLDAGSVDKNTPSKLAYKSSKMRNARSRLMSRLKNLINDKRKKVDDTLQDAPHSPIFSSASYVDVAAGLPNRTIVHFHLAASINAENDCLLVPSMENTLAGQKPFAVHWLNNKELVYGIGAEKLLAEALIADQPMANPSSDSTTTRRSGVTAVCDTATTEVLSEPAPVTSADPSVDSAPSTSSAPQSDRVHPIPSGISLTETTASKDSLDVKLDVLIKQWLKSNDVLFAIHPVDGSLLSWTVEWLDDAYRQPTVSFTSRFPSAFPLTDAASLNPYLSTFNPHDPLYVDVIQRHLPSGERDDSSAQWTGRALERHSANMLYLLTSHENGSLNLWHLSVDEESNFTVILNISHASRMCGHRFQISKVVAHPVLPLMLTASQFGNTDEKTHEDGRAELILWRINPVGPLCKSGGVRELARMTACSSKSFTSLAWIPAILPSCTLGSVCNSPSSCFVASEGGILQVYQAIVDAAGLLAEIYASEVQASGYSSRSSTVDEDLTPSEETSPIRARQSLKETFNVASTQSTAKPGCVLRLTQIVDAQHDANNLLLLHVFNERLVLGTEDDPLSIERDQLYSLIDILLSPSNGLELLRDMDECGETTDRNAPTPYYRAASPIGPSAAQLVLQSQKVCDQELSLPEGVSMLSVVPAAGHLPSSSLYPACKAPYVLLSSCSDEHIRFWKCAKADAPDGSVFYSWHKWGMVSDSVDSDLEMDGQIFSVSAAHSGRFACAYLPEGVVVSSITNANSIKVGVFECESSGGVEWLREDTLLIDNKPFIEQHANAQDGMLREGFETREEGYPTEQMKRVVSDRDVRAKHYYNKMRLGDLVRIDWVSTEDGSHILTVGIGSSVHMFTQVSQGVAQRNIVMMKEHETHRRAPLRKASSLANPERISTRLVRWLCIRYLELQSADGLPPLPTALTWVRDGLLIVGMHSEMRCYNQWNLAAKATHSSDSANERSRDNPVKRKMTGNALTMPTLNISPSHSMLDQLSKKSKMDSSVANKQKLLKEIMHKVMTAPRDLQDLLSKDEHVLQAVSDEGLFEAARLASPILPQYHPKQLIELLNSGKTRKVKAILLHVLNCLKQSNVSIPNPLSRAASIRKMSVTEPNDASNVSTLGQNMDVSRGLSDTFDDANPEYDELDGIAPLPLYLLMSADNATDNEEGQKAANLDDENPYNSLFETEQEEEDLDEVLGMDDEFRPSARSRSNSFSADMGQMADRVSTVFTARHNRLLTDFLTHTHLPGLSSVDQMHLLAVADTLSHFSADVMDKLAQANAAFQGAQPTVFRDAAGGYATAAAGSETVDECGLRFLMAMKQHEYLLLCLPLKQKQILRQKGLSSSNIIWALHSETETELLNAIPGLHKAQPTWNELRSLGVAWWLKNTSALRSVIEQLAKAAFQQNQDPLDASLYYLAMKKKNVLTHLFRTVKDQRMAEFFMQDFNEERWKKAALKNAFVLMGKQRFQHAAAFFLLAGSLRDALQAVLSKLHDLQLAMVVIRLYENDHEKQWSLMRELLCHEILGVEPAELDAADRRNIGNEDDPIAQSLHASRDPFERSMAFWHLKEYSRAAATLVEEGGRKRFVESSTDCSLSDIFNFYSFLRNHPLVVRQRLSDAGIQMGSTEKFLAVAKQLAALVTPAERRLYFRTASAHMASGCPILALDVLMRLPRNISMVVPGSFTLSSLVNGGQESAALGFNSDRKEEDSVNAFDWSAPSNVIQNDQLELKWSDDEEEAIESNGDQLKSVVKENGEAIAQNRSFVNHDRLAHAAENETRGTVLDIIAQHLKFVASIRIMMEELSTLASGFEVDGGQLRFQLFKWLEKEVDVLKEVCDYESSVDETAAALMDESDDVDEVIPEQSSAVPLHEALRNDRLDLAMRIRSALRRRRWLRSNQKLLRSFTSYCTLHSAQNYRLTSALMELLLLLLEVQQDSGNLRHLNEPMPVVNSFPLLVASVSSCKMFVSSPLHFIENQCSDLVLTIVEFDQPPRIDHSLAKVYKLYNLCQGLSSCLYQSLCDIGNFYSPWINQQQTGALTRRPRCISWSEDVHVMTIPSKWPGVDNLVALLNREKDEEAPQLRLLLAETFVAVMMSLFSYAFTAYDSRWLYRLAAHVIDAKQFANAFGGGGEKKLKTVPPARPPRPVTPRRSSTSAAYATTSDSPTRQPRTQSNLSIDSSAFRAKFHAKVFGTDSPVNVPPGTTKSSSVEASGVSEQIVYRWVPPNKNIVQLFAEKPPVRSKEELGVDYDSDEQQSDVEMEEDEGDEEPQCKEHNNPDGYAWLLMRVALVHQQLYRLREFITLAGFDPADLPAIAPRIDAVFKLLNSWAQQLSETLNDFPGGCPSDILPNTTLDNTDNHLGPSLRKYRTLIEPGNTPFESDEPAALPVRRLWAYLVRQEHLTRIFIRYIFGAKGQLEEERVKPEGTSTDSEQSMVPGAFKIIQREHEPIAAFACSQVKPGWIVVSTTRELQEMDISSFFDEWKNSSSSSWLTNRTELDIALNDIKKDPLKDNDDYQLLMDSGRRTASANFLLKRQVGGIRRMDSHPSLPYYLSGSSDGSIRLWEWGVGQPLFTPRVAGQYAKVTKVIFSANGNKLAAVDGDGLLSLWQASHGLPIRKPFFNQKCHSKSAADVKFVGSSSSVLVTAGLSSGDQNVALWDTLMPQSKAMVHNWIAHPEGASSIMYLQGQQTIVSGGRHGEVCLWDIRQRQLRATVKCFENSTVKCLVGDPSQDVVIAGSNDGDIKIWNVDTAPQLVLSLNGEHAARGGFSLRQVASGGIQGVQQLFLDAQMRLFSCGADCSLKCRPLSTLI
uniref:RAVE complex protein Rav1 C-terminal domain-containing protein n=1 Tax=Ascaris lumbricoides TaxID=6252 RepID=A0A9J2PHZ4_ASCLU